MMSPFPPGGFEVTQPSNAQLTVICHYAWWYGFFAGLVFGVPALRNLVRGVRTHQVQPMLWSLVLMIACLITISTFPTGDATFDKMKKTVTFQKRGFFFISHRYEYPLDQVRYATLETATADRRFVVVLKGGARIGLSAFTSQAGQSQAVDAVNDFLGVKFLP
jgi:hypothetical protein